MAGRSIPIDRHLVMSAISFTFMVAGLLAIIYVQNISYDGVVAEMRANVAFQEEARARQFKAQRDDLREMFRVAAVGMDRYSAVRFRLWARIAAELGVPRTEIDRIIEVELPGSSASLRTEDIAPLAPKRPSGEPRR